MNYEPLNTSSPFAVVVNDGPTQLNLLSGLLRKAGLEPLAFAAAETALADMSARADALPALIVTDLYMPGIDGWRFCRLLRSPEYAAFNKVPILVVSATFAGEEATRIAADLGAEAFLSSPVDGQRFLDQVHATLTGQRVRIPPRVLIVEDSRTQSKIIKQALETHGYQVDTAFTVRAAEEAFGKTAYDVTVLDYHLPDGQGDTLLDEFRAQRPDCVCLMMTNDTGPDLALDWMKRGAAAYLQKPFQTGYLIELCAKACRERSLMRVQDLLEIRTRELRASEENYRLLIENSHDIIYTLTTEGIFTFVSPAWTALLGHPVPQIDGQPFQTLVHPDDLAGYMVFLKRVIETGQRQEGVEYRARHIDGSWCWHTSSAVPLRDKAGSIIGLQGNATDITKRKRAEEALQEKLAELERMNKLMVGREHKMIELKREINGLCGQLNLPKRYSAPENIAQESRP